MNKRLLRQIGSIMMASLLAVSAITGDVMPVYAALSDRLVEEDNIISDDTCSSIEGDDMLAASIDEDLVMNDTTNSKFLEALELTEKDKVISDNVTTEIVSENVPEVGIDVKKYEISSDGTYNGPDLSNPAYQNSNPYPNGQCTWYCYGRVKEKLGITMPTLWGDAKGWRYLAEQNGLRTGDTPAENSIMVMGMGSCNNINHNGVHGHVAFVEYISGNYMRITDGNAKGINGYAGRDIPAYTAGQVASSTDYLSCPTCYAGYPVLGYIYFGNNMSSGNPIGVVDSVVAGYGTVKVRGWAFDPDRPDCQPEIHVFVDGVTQDCFIGKGYSNIKRTDVNEAYNKQIGDYHGFEFTINTDKVGTHKIYIYACNINGTPGNSELLNPNGDSVNIKAVNNPIGDINSIIGGNGIISVKGWAFDLDDPSKQLEIHVFADGAEQKHFVGKGIANAKRTDVNQAYNKQVGDYHGIDFSVNTTLNGQHTIYVYALNIGPSGENVRIPNDGKTVTITQKTAVTGVSLNKSSASIVAGKTETLTATVAPSNATNKSVTWTSSNTNIATVSNTGVVTARAQGTATITVKTVDGNKTATCKVTVNPAIISVTGVSLNKSSTNIIAGNTESLTATISPSNATNKNVTWTSIDLSN